MGAGIGVLGTESNEGAFSVKGLGEGFCFVGRKENGARGYDALLGFCGSRGCRVFGAGTVGDDYSYSVETYGDMCLALITSFTGSDSDISLVLYDSEGVKRILSAGGRGDDMGWFLRKVKDGYLVVGGVNLRGWDILVVKYDQHLNLLWSLVLGTERNEYAYSAVESKGVYYIVGRTDFRGNWDGFILTVSRDGLPGGSWLIGSRAKDYLRFIGRVGERLMAVGRTEARGESDILIFSPLTQFYRIIDCGEYDYGRAFYEGGNLIVLGGDLVKGGDNQGFILFLDRRLNLIGGYSIGGEDVESLRMVERGGLIAGYTYSFSMDNDLLIGGFSKKCPSFVKPESFRLVGGRMDMLRIPLSVREYRVERKSLSFSFSEIKLRKRFSCPPQE